MARNDGKYYLSYCYIKTRNVLCTTCIFRYLRNDPPFTEDGGFELHVIAWYRDSFTTVHVVICDITVHKLSGSKVLWDVIVPKQFRAESCEQKGSCSLHVVCDNSIRLCRYFATVYFTATDQLPREEEKKKKEEEVESLGYWARFNAAD